MRRTLRRPARRLRARRENRRGGPGARRLAGRAGAAGAGDHAGQRKPPVEIVNRQYPAATQEAFGKAAAAAIGFDFQSRPARRDASSVLQRHGARTTAASPRATTSNSSTRAFFGILHEAGHGIYDQGLRTDQYGLPPGCIVSLGIHESQSRMWENLVGRSRAFWQHFFPKLQAAFPGGAERACRSTTSTSRSTTCEPSLIRVEADEATYNLHILIRFELEQALLTGDLPIARPARRVEGEVPPVSGHRAADDADGCCKTSTGRPA